MVEGQNHFLKGRLFEAAESFKRMSRQESFESRDLGQAYLTALYAECGRLDLALDSSRQNVENARTWGMASIVSQRLLQHSYLQCESGDIAKATQSADEAAKLESGPRFTFKLATSYRILGRKRDLERLIISSAAWPKIPIAALATNWARAELAYMSGDVARAESLFLEALSNHSPYNFPRWVPSAHVFFSDVQQHCSQWATLWYRAGQHWPGAVRNCLKLSLLRNPSNTQFQESLRQLTAGGAQLTQISL